MIFEIQHCFQINTCQFGITLHYISFDQIQTSQPLQQLLNKVTSVMKGYILLILFVLDRCLGFQVANPIWKTSIYFRAGQQNVIKVLTGNDKTPNYTFTFSSPLTGVPNIAYGIAKYQGIDYLPQEYFQIFRIGLTSTSFSVAVQITGYTSLFILRVPYLAIQPTFPHHMNTFDNTPLNYSSGLLVNVTTRSMSLKTYTNTINYTLQCGSTRKYNKFTQTPLTKYKMLMFMTSFFVQTTKETNLLTQNFSLSLKIEYGILSFDTYYVKILLLRNVIVSRIHFSQIFFDEADVQSSYKYKLIYQIWHVNDMGGEKEIPQEFQDNFIMGISYFDTPLGMCGFDYMWDWKKNSTFFGVVIERSITRKNVCAFSQIFTTILYVQTWQCLTPHFYYNITTKLCQNQCGLYTYGFKSLVDIEYKYQCLPCNWACSKCTLANKCTQCNNDDMRIFNGTCYCPYGYLDNFIVTKCEQCLDPHCLICQKNVNYKATPQPGDPVTTSSINLCVMCEQNYFLNPTTRYCQAIAKCNISNNELLDYTTNTCEVCKLIGCLQCRQSMQLKFNGITTDIFQVGIQANQLSISGTKRLLLTDLGVISCAVCDSSQGYFRNLLMKQCQKCTLLQCLNCSSLYTCSKCNSLNQHFLNSTNKQCQKCEIQGCSICQSLTQCKVCNFQKGFFLDNKLKKCRYCGLGCKQCAIYGLVNRKTECKLCDTGLKQVNDGCQCQKGYYLSQMLVSLLVTCQPCDVTCKTCDETSSTCLSCYFQQFRLLSAKTYSCLCNSSNYIQSLGQTICQKLNSSLCDMGYLLKNNSCSEICGDGVRIDTQCDDGNLEQNDGCSKQCKIQTDFICNGDIYDKSQCHYAGNVTVKMYNITKDPHDNMLVIKLKLSPLLVLYQSLDWIRGLYFSSTSTTIQILQAKMISVDILQTKSKYHENIKGKNISLLFSQQKSYQQTQQQQTALSSASLSAHSSLMVKSFTDGRFLQTSLTPNITFNFVTLQLDFKRTTNNLDVAYYPQSTYKLINAFETVFAVVVVLYLVLVFMALLLFKRIVPVMVVFLSIQLCFISLSSIQNVQPQTFSIINNFDQILGLNNLNFVNKFCKNRQISSNFKNLQFQYCFISNLNLMFIFQVLALLASLVAGLIGLKLQKVKTFSSHFKRMLSNLVFFNLPNVVISIGLIYFTDMKNMTNFIFPAIQVLLTVAHIFLIFLYRKLYFIQIQVSDYKKLDTFQNSVSDESGPHENDNNSHESIKISSQNSSSNILATQRHKRVQELTEQFQLNHQVLFFLFFIIGTSCIGPIGYLIFSQSSSLIANLISLGITSILIVVQIIINPFSSEHSQNRSFSEIKINYFFTYAFMVLFFVVNILFTVIEDQLSDDIQNKVFYIQFLSYGQIALFLCMMIHLIVAWSYSIYLSFFQEEIQRKYSQKVQIIDPDHKVSQHNSSDVSKKQSLEQHQKIYIDDQSSVSNQNYYSIDHSNGFSSTSKIKRDIKQAPHINKNLIFQINQLQDAEDRF